MLAGEATGAGATMSENATGARAPLTKKGGCASLVMKCFCKTLADVAPAAPDVAQPPKLGRVAWRQRVDEMLQGSEHADVEKSPLMGYLHVLQTQCQKYLSITRDTTLRV